MLVNELRTALEQYDKAALKEIAVTLYKHIPKGKRESKGLDDLLLSFSKEKAKPAKGSKPKVDFASLEKEIVQFMNYADESLYLAPNRIVSKDKRAKWRFEVKRFIKELLAVGGEHSEASAELLAGIYDMLSYGCSYHIFVSEDPFAAVGYAQADLLSLALGKLFYDGYNEDSVKNAVYLTLDSGVDRETLHVQLLYVLREHLKTADTIEMAIRHCISFKNNYDAFQAGKSLFKYVDTWDGGYRRKEHGNYATEMVLLLQFGLHEYDEGIRFFWDNYDERDAEIKLYILLRFLDFHGLEEYWVREYERALKKGLKPRGYLQDKYAEMKQA